MPEEIAGCILVNVWHSTLTLHVARPDALTMALLVQLHGQGCGTCTYNGGKVGIRESKCTRASDSRKYVLVAGAVGVHSSTVFDAASAMLL